MTTSTAHRSPRAWHQLALATCLVLATASVGLAQALDRQLKDILNSSKLPGVQVAVSVIDVSSGDVLAGINAKQAMMPASNLKLLTSGTALLVLGKDFEFRTRIVRDRDRIIVIGAGDPAFGEPALLQQMNISSGAFLDQIAASIQKSGMTGIREVIIDDRIFDREYIHTTWPEDQLNRWYASEVSGLNFHANILQIYPKAGDRPGPTPTPRTEPSASWLEIVNNAQTVSQGQTGVWATRDQDPSTRFRLFGNVRATPIEPIEVTMHEPGLVFGRLLADRLSAAGLGTAGLATAIPARLANSEDQYGTGDVLTVVRTPIATILRRCNVESYNLFADALFKRVGADVTGQPGSWINGASVARMQIHEKIGNELGELIMADGGGLSRENRVTALMMASWLAALSRTTGVSEAFVDSLAKPGEGTLKSRFDDRKLTCELRAKSGFIRGVQCLSGYLTNPDSKRRVAFSILLNNVNEKVPGGAAKKFHEDIVEQVDRWMARNSNDR